MVWQMRYNQAELIIPYPTPGDTFLGQTSEPGFVGERAIMHVYPESVAAAVLERCQGRCECRMHPNGSRCAEPVLAPTKDYSPLFYAAVTEDLCDPGNWCAFCPACAAVWAVHLKGRGCLLPLDRLSAAGA